MKKLLITGFEPFGGEAINPSWEAVRGLPEAIGEYTLTKRCVPVVFGEDIGDPGSHYVPEGAEYTILYQAEDGYQMKEMPFNKSYYDWTIFWPGYKAP